MTATTERPGRTAGSRRAGTRRAPRPQRARWHWWAGAGVLVAILVGAWVWGQVNGLLGAARTVQAKAAVAQAELEAFRDTLSLGDEVTAAGHLDAGEQALFMAQRAAQDEDVRRARSWPYIGRTVKDLDHLLAAAGILTGSARDALSVYENFSGEDSKLFRNGRFSIPAIRQAQGSVAAITESMDRAENELRQVTGDGLKGAEALEKKRSGLRQVQSLRSEIVALTPLLDALPEAVGSDGRKTYLIAIMNPTEMRASGGAPLSVAFMRFKNGKLSIPLKGSASALTGTNREFFWNRLAGKRDPFALPKGEAERFVNTTFNPSFPVSGEQMLRATPVNFGIKTDGVIALDLLAIGKLLDVTGPIESEEFGTINSQNIARKLLVKAYRGPNDDASVAERRAGNDELMTIMLSRLTEGGGLIGKARALGEAVPGRHLQMYFRDDQLQRVIQQRDMAGSVPAPERGNLTAVYTQNGNGNKLDIYQQRTIRETVQLREDGSALVRRTVELGNPSPRYTASFPDRLRGYDTRYAKNLVINLMPPGARVIDEPRVDLTGSVDRGVDQDGRTFAEAAVMLEPKGSAELTWVYEVPDAAIRDGDALVLRNHVAPQAMLNDPTLVLTVLAPQGWTLDVPKAWQPRKGGASVTVPMNETRVLKVRAERAAS